MDPRRILIVEAQNEFALQMAAVLRQAGYATAVARSAAEASRDIEERRPHLVEIRAELPEQSGFVLCAKLRRDKETKALPILLCSSDSSPESLKGHASLP